MTTATPVDLRNTTAVIEFAQQLIGSGETTNDGLRPVVSVDPDVRCPPGVTAYRITVSGEGFGGPASIVVVVDPSQGEYRAEIDFRYSYSLLLRQVERRFTHSE